MNYKFLILIFILYVKFPINKIYELQNLCIHNNKLSISTKRLYQLTKLYEVNIDYFWEISKNNDYNEHLKIDLITIGNNFKKNQNRIQINAK